MKIIFISDRSVLNINRANVSRRNEAPSMNSSWAPVFAKAADFRDFARFGVARDECWKKRKGEKHCRSAMQTKSCRWFCRNWYGFQNVFAERAVICLLTNRHKIHNIGNLIRRAWKDEFCWFYAATEGEQFKFDTGTRKKSALNEATLFQINFPNNYDCLFVCSLINKQLSKYNKCQCRKLMKKREIEKVRSEQKAI